MSPKTITIEDVPTSKTYQMTLQKENTKLTLTILFDVPEE